MNYLPTGGNIVGVFKFNLLQDVEAIRCEWLLDVEMFEILSFCLFVSHKTVCSHFFVMVTSLWMVFCEYETELFWFLSVAEGTEVVVDSITEDELTGVLSDKVESWYLPCF